MQNFVIYLIIINITAFFTYGADKWLAKKHFSRVSERTLILVGVIGGTVGAFVAMQLFRHKTLHKKFTFGIPLIFAMQCLVAYGLVSLGLIKL